jgi:hypothetical protein
VPDVKDFTLIPHINAPVNQQLSRSCYNYSGALMYENMASKKWFDINIDRGYVNYRVYRVQLERLIKQLEETGVMDDTFHDDGSQASFYRAIQRWGIIPQGIRNNPVDAHGGWSRDMTTMLVAQTSAIQKDSTLDPTQKIERLRKLIDQLTSYYGNPPIDDIFKYGDKIYTPTSLHNTIGVDIADIVPLVNIPTEQYGSIVDNNRFVREDYQTKEKINLNMPINILHDLISTSIAQWYPVEVWIDTGEPWSKAYHGNNQMLYSVIPSWWPQGYNLDHESTIPIDQYQDTIATLCAQDYHQMSPQQQEQLRSIRRIIWDITPNHVIILVGMYQDTDGNIWYLAYDSSRNTTYGDDTSQHNMRIISADYIDVNNVWVNIHTDICKQYATIHPEHGALFDKMTQAHF